MRRIITMLLFAMTAAVAAYAQKAQYKVEESSAKKMPEWVMSTEKDYLIVTATGGDIEEAKAAVIESVKRQIAQSIATRIVAESNLQTSAFESGDSFSKSQSLETSVMSRTAKLPFIGEISLSKAADYYWERRYYRSTGRYDYFYAVKYPFSDFEMRQLVTDYQLYDTSFMTKSSTRDSRSSGQIWTSCLLSRRSERTSTISGYFSMSSTYRIPDTIRFRSCPTATASSTTRSPSTGFRRKKALSWPISH